MIHFPAVFKLSGQDELLYISDHSSLLQQSQLHQAYLLPDDLLIDSGGEAYLLIEFSQDGGLPKASKIYTLPELTSLVQAHFFAVAQSCLIKIQAPDIKALFYLLQDPD